MKSLIGVLILTLSLAAAHGQGQIVFANKVGSDVDAPVIDAATLHGPGPGYTAQLLLVNTDGSLTPLTPASVFRSAGTGSAAIADRYWIGQTVDVPGVAPGTPATFVVRAWLTEIGSYENALKFGPGPGQSAPFTVVVGGGMLPPANLTTLRSFSVSVLPEPSPVLLGISGGCLIWIFRKMF